MIVAEDTVLGFDETVLTISLAIVVAIALVVGLMAFLFDDPPPRRTARENTQRDETMMGCLGAATLAVAAVITGAVALVNLVLDSDHDSNIRKYAAALVLVVTFLAIRALVRWGRS
jgi:protein-S-isoprenylcysteine O-methyltransferase Ste14